MSTLGLSGPPSKNDSLLKRLFWPSVGNAVDADLLGQQGFWICLIVSILTLGTSLFQGQWIIGILGAVFFFLGGIGVREHDIFAAIAVSAVYWMNILVVIFTGHFPGFLVFIAAALLTANIRGCLIAASSMKQGDPDEIPLRFHETWRDRLVDQMPARIWPRIRIVFYVLAALMLLLSVAGSIVILLKGPHA